MESAVRNTTPATVAVIVGVVAAVIPTALLFLAVNLLFVIPLAAGIVCIVLGVVGFRTDSPLGRHVGWLAVLLMIVAVGVPFGLIAYHNRSGHPIVLVVPAGYRGTIRLVIDRERGAEVPLQNGRYTYHIPDDGTLTIKDDSPFRQWHSLTVFDTSGNAIPEDIEDKCPPGVVTIRSLGSGTRTQNGERENFIDYFVGTGAERQQSGDKPK
jgi:hypothetical protein